MYLVDSFMEVVRYENHFIEIPASFLANKKIHLSMGHFQSQKNVSHS